MTALFDYEAWPSRAGEPWGGAEKGDSEWDNLDFHVDLGCGKLPKARIGIDRFPAPGVAIVADLDAPPPTLRPHQRAGVTLAVPDRPGLDAQLGRASNRRGDGELLAYCTGLPFADSSIKSIISHHFFEHVGPGFVPLIDEVYRVLEPGGVLRAITPLFPSWSAVSDPDHKRYFMAEDDGFSTWDTFCGTHAHHWMDSFSVPYMHARFEKVDQDMTARSEDPFVWWREVDARELRVALTAVK